MANTNEHEPVRHPGAILYSQFLVPLGLTPGRLSVELRIVQSRISDLVNERRGVTVHTAIRLAKLLGTTPHYWMNLQMDYDIAQALADEKFSDDLEHITELSSDLIACLDPVVFSVAARSEPALGPGTGPLVQTPDSGTNTAAVSQLPNEERQIYDLLSDGPLHFDVLCDKSAMTAGGLTATLTILEMEHLIRAEIGGFYSRAVMADRSSRSTSGRR